MNFLSLLFASLPSFFLISIKKIVTGQGDNSYAENTVTVRKGNSLQSFQTEMRSMTGKVVQKKSCLGPKKSHEMIGILHWMRWKTNWENGQKAFSSGKGRKKTKGKNRGIYEGRKVASWQSLGELQRELRQKLSGEGVEEVGRGIEKCILLRASARGSVCPRLPYYRVILSLLLPSTL